MLFPDAYALWITSFLLVVTTRNFFAPFLPLAAIALPLLDHNVQRTVAVVLYGAVAGFAISAAVGSRVMIPIHAFSGKNPHLAGPLSVLSASFIPYAFAVAVGWVAPFEEWEGNDAGRVAFYSIMFIVLVLTLGSILYMSWMGKHQCPMTYRYTDSGIYANSHPPSRYAAEAALALTLLAASHLIWIFTAHAPTSWAQFAGGIVTLGIKILLWLGIWRLGDKRYAMENTHFSSDRSQTSWASFVAIIATVDIVSTVVWIIAATFSTTGLSVEITLIFTTLGTLVVAALAWVFLTPTFSIHTNSRSSAPSARRSRRSAGSGSVMSEEERQRRIEELL